MTRLLTYLVLLAGPVAASLAGADFCRAEGNWAGVDETVIEKFAVEGGRPPREPLINTDQGDLLLWLFLTAGAAGGFIGGYAFRGLLPPRVAMRGEHAPHS